MPVHLPAQNRRQFLVTVSAGLVACSSDAFGRDVEGDLVYLLNDTHIGEKHPPGSPVPSHLRLAVATSTAVAQRRGKPVLLKIRALDMHQTGHQILCHPERRVAHGPCADGIY
jgi:hypothetical protein